ncbi:glucose 1-dehydrogenase [Allonocardiopsis opalescens]|uniref:glucose 1-dehydrogenase n=1 Tax=Allonocardiopsis opalescens TaxID=1144618 RepID=UPI000D04A107|nr:glucose 1-dehydrogenase [Allonocardiopsis opalescens]
MRALTVHPGQAGTLRVEEVPEPRPGPGELLVDALALGVCGTDREIADGLFGAPPPGADRLVIGHESLGRVASAPPDSGFAQGDLVVGVVRRPDPVPCGPCGQGQFDMCRNGRYTERGITGHHGFGAQRWTVEADYAVRLDPELERVGVLLEPTTIVAKAWDQIERIGARAWFEPRRVLVAGAGPIGLLAALLGRQRGLDCHVLDRVDSGRKPELVAALGATYHTGGLAEVARAVRPDVVIEATGVARLVVDAMHAPAGTGIACLLGVSPDETFPVDIGAVNGDMVRLNSVVFGSVNANLHHYALAVRALAAADRAWLEGMITRRLPLDRAAEAFHPADDEVKVVIDL